MQVAPELASTDALVAERARVDSTRLTSCLTSTEARYSPTGPPFHPTPPGQSIPDEEEEKLLPARCGIPIKYQSIAGAC
ncbi:hypothetical protein CH63R_02645 [Colletotrichum higginsianum IMI 349063]|uniref:Uncharacterized protein n=1 Tax=Colletotrichum higginsianum (strain IMI 349063) TaxID=759273 RepID=A0A1B7YPI0_COLHI|nr:hypothetical protein CH63R_02645 [Colletotrichum higginsianum IMI 349063]OBR13919.1 hypothetical protein CH63R_02645 [Colletotrichum higginsianum IMI 349063]GJC95423.1 hypothetical protein ColKHC_04249 [Colletotrichum higginsianum]